MQTACKGRPRDEVTHIGMMRRHVAKSFNNLRHGSGSNKPVKPMVSNLASQAAQIDASLAVGPAKDENLARGPDPNAAAANISRVGTGSCCVTDKRARQSLNSRHAY